MAMLEDDEESVPMPTPPGHMQRDVKPPGVGCLRINLVLPLAFPFCRDEAGQ